MYTMYMGIPGFAAPTGSFWRRRQVPIVLLAPFHLAFPAGDFFHLTGASDTTGNRVSRLVRFYSCSPICYCSRSRSWSCSCSLLPLFLPSACSSIPADRSLQILHRFSISDIRYLTFLIESPRIPLTAGRSLYPIYRPYKTGLGKKYSLFIPFCVLLFHFVA